MVRATSDSCRAQVGSSSSSDIRNAIVRGNRFVATFFPSTLLIYVPFKTDTFKSKIELLE